MTAPDVIDAHPAADDERHQVVTTLCRAFVDDPIYRWMVPDDAQRRRSAAIFYARFVDACWLHVSDSPAIYAMWRPPQA